MTEMTMDLQEQIARINRSLAETEKLQEETRKFVAEAHKLTRDAALAPWQVAFAGMAAGAALVGATVAVMKVLGG